MADDSTREGEPADLNSAIAAAFDEVMGVDPETETAPEPEPEEATESAPDDEAELEIGGDPEPDEDDSEPADDDEPSALEPPAMWSKDQKEEFASLPRNGQEVLISRYKDMEADYTRKTQGLAELRRALDPIRDRLTLEGIGEGAFVSRLIAADRTLQSDPETAFLALAKHYMPDATQAQAVIRKLAQVNGVTLDDIDNEDVYTDPSVLRLQQEVNELRTSQQQKDAQIAEGAQRDQLERVESFRVATDESGNLVHPHFEAVMPVMGALISAGITTDLDDAYKRAVNADPSLSQQLRDQGQRVAAEAAKKAARAKATKAKKAALPRGRPEGGGKSESGSLLDDLTAAWDAAS